jgi:GMP synthase (glutamine-hydrolysing)
MSTPFPTPTPPKNAGINIPTRESLPHDEVIVILDFGSQTAQLIARRVREAGAFSILLHPATPADKIAALKPRGVILSGGPASVYEAGAPTCDPAIFKLGVPLLGICYGMQLACHLMGCRVDRGASREFGRAQLNIIDKRDMFAAIPPKTAVWMSHGDQVHGLDPAHGFVTLASTETCPHAAVKSTRPGLTFYGVQFHPEVTHTPHGVEMLRNFVYEVCGVSGSWKMADFMETEVRRIRAKVGEHGRVICGLSGGVDSSVCAALIHRAIGDRLTCIFVDTGLLRKNERELVENTFRETSKIDLRVIDASVQFLADLDGIEDPQEKRKRIGNRFIRVFEQAANELAVEGGSRPGARLAAAPAGRAAVSGAAGGGVGVSTLEPAMPFLAQGTLYPDVIESGHGHAGQSANIKLHHNVGGLPEDTPFQLLEPLRDLFKDEVRKLGEVLGLPDQIVWRHPFPGPGLAVRIIGSVTRTKLDLLRECDEILLEEIVANNLYRSTSQVFAVLLPVKSVGVMGDGRTYDSCVAIRAVETQDFMTADWARIPFSVLANISNRIINEVRGVNRVVYDISSKPPATIEWE